MDWEEEMGDVTLLFLSAKDKRRVNRDLNVQVGDGGAALYTRVSSLIQKGYSTIPQAAV